MYGEKPSTTVAPRYTENAAVDVGEDSRRPLIDRTIRELERQIERVHRLTQGVAVFVDRTTGGQPKPANVNSAQTPEGSRAEALDRRASHLSSALSELEMTVERLQEI